MSFTYKNSIFILFFLIVQLCYTYGACPSLKSTETLTITCKLNNTTLNNCKNPMEGTEAHLTCKMFYEEVTTQSNPKRLCQAGRWDGPIPQCYPICGKKRVKESSNNEKNENELLDYPWHVGIYTYKKAFLSGGTLIAMNIVLTAASSLTYEHNYEVVTFERIFVMSGKNYVGFDDSRDNFAQSATVKDVHFPKDYKGYKATYNSDIAILVLRHPFEPSQVVQPVCLNFDLSSYNLLLPESGILTAWDSSISDTDSAVHDPDVLKVVRVLPVPNSKCNSNRYRNYQAYITIDKICGENLDNVSSTCNLIVIEGGGMSLKNKINDRYYIIGILSTSPYHTHSPKCEPVQYSLYTAVYHHRKFVETYATANIEM